MSRGLLGGSILCILRLDCAIVSWMVDGKSWMESNVHTNFRDLFNIASFGFPPSIGVRKSSLPFFQFGA